MLKNLILDLGGLFIDVYMHRTRELLEKHQGKSLSLELQAFSQAGLSDQYEKGLIDDQTFLQGLNTFLPKKLEEQQLIEAWNAVLGDFHLERLQGIQPLRTHYRLVLLSNTNSLHVNGFETQLESKFGFRSLTPFFDAVYYSQELGQRKPDAACFAKVLAQEEMLAAETLFIDDTPGHLVGAKAVGLHTALHPSNTDILRTLRDFGLFDH